jgi:hypothetical protein
MYLIEGNIMVMKKIYRAIRFILLLILALAIVFFVNSSFEIGFVNKKFSDFKNRGEAVNIDPDDTLTTYYKVPKMYDYEDTSRTVVDFENLKLGSEADIILTNRNPLRMVPSLKEPMDLMATNYFLGHASLNAYDDMLYETLGNNIDPSDDGVAYRRNSWLRSAKNAKSEDEYPIIVALRIKNTTEETRNKMLEYAESKIGNTYNYTFVFNRTKTFYCTDLVSRASAYAGINLNYDYLATTGNDLILSKNVYIIFYRQVRYVDGIKHVDVYFLDEN